MVVQASKKSSDTGESIGIVAHGVPVLLVGNRDEAHEQNMQQWRWLFCKISIHTATISSVPKILRPFNPVTIWSPPLMSVNFRNREDVTEAQL